MSAITLAVTDAGSAPMVDAAAGGTVAVRIVSVGISADEFFVAPTLTALPGETASLSAVAGTVVDPSTVHLVVRGESDGVYSVRGLGVYLDDGTLFVAYSQPEPIFTKSALSTFFLSVDLRFLPGEAGMISFASADFINPPASRTVKGVAYLAGPDDFAGVPSADKIVTPATFAARLQVYVTTDKLGVAGGVATLGDDGRLKSDQIPAYDVADTFVVQSQAEMLALGAGRCDFAVWQDVGKTYILSATPATALANWIEFLTPGAPVQSVKGKTGTVVLSPGDIGAVPVTRSFSAAGLVTGGGNGQADRTFTVTAATREEAEAGVATDRALTPAAIGRIIRWIRDRVPKTRKVATAGALRGGGALDADRELTVAVATADDVAAGISNDLVLTPASLTAMPHSFTPNGYFPFPGGLILQWGQYRRAIQGEPVIGIAFPIPFPNGVLATSATAFLPSPSIYRDLWPQVVSPNTAGMLIQMQAGTSDDRRCDGFDWIVLGF